MEVCVFGSGVIGLSVALELALKNYKVKVISKSLKEATSWVAGGMLAPFSEGLRGEFLKLCRKSLSLYGEYLKRVEEVSKSRVEFRRGIYRVLDREQEELLREYLKEGVEFERLRLKDLDVVLYKQEGSVNSKELMLALIKALKRLKVEFVKDRVRLEGREVVGFRGRYYCELFVFCLGAWSRRYLKVPAFPQKGQIVELSPLKDLDRVIYSEGAYLIPRKSSFLIGATTETEGRFDRAKTLKKILELLNNAKKVLPEVENLELRKVEVGFRPKTPDLLPIFDLEDNLVFLTGHYRNGILLAPVSAKFVLDLLEGKGLEDYKIYSLKRFG